MTSREQLKVKDLERMYVLLTDFISGIISYQEHGYKKNLINELRQKIGRILSHRLAPDWIKQDWFMRNEQEK